MAAKLRLHLEIMTLRFLDKLRNCTEDVVESFVGSVEEKLLVPVLESVEDVMRTNSDNADKLVSHNLLIAILSILKWEKLVLEPRLLLKVRNLVYAIGRWSPLARTALVNMGIGYVLAEIMEKEAENQEAILAWTGTGEYVSTCHVISLFFPTIENRFWTKDINKIASKIMSEGLTTSAAEASNMLKATFPTVYNICQMPKCPVANQVLLLKLIFMANNLRQLEELIPVVELLSFVKNLMARIPMNENRILIGFAIVFVLRNYREDFVKVDFFHFLKSIRSITNVLMSEGRSEWIWCNYSSMIPQWLNDQTISKIQVNDECLATQIEDIDELLGHIISNTEGEDLGTLDGNYYRLRLTMKIILNLPDFSSHKGKLSVSSEGIEKFRALVTLFVSTVDAILVNNDFITVYPDLPDLDDILHVPENPMDIRLCLNKSSSFDRVLGPSESTELTSNPLVRALRLLSIFYEVNENWGILFGSLSTDRLIDRSCYISKVLEEAMNSIRSRKICGLYLIPDAIIRLTEAYPFLMSIQNRNFFRKSYTRNWMSRVHTRQTRTIGIHRRYTLNWIVNQLDMLENEAYRTWTFTFYGEIGTGIGPTKEFYSVFSRDCKRFEYDLWSGEPSKSRDGVLYVNPQLGLFPSPKPSGNPRAEHCLSAIGMVMAKSLMDEHRMDINFSDAFYKCLFKKNLEAQQLSLADFKYVMPSIYKFIESLVDALREKWSIENDKTLSVEEKEQFISKIVCDGCPFEDLCVNFTIPGSPDIEMEEGGSDTLLSIDNLEKYLKLLTWWVLYKNPQESIKTVRDGFGNFLNPRFMRFFYPHEYDGILCGLNKEQWTVEYLKNNSVLDELNPEAPVVQYLFEVLSSLSASDQRSFLQFATSTPRLPVGGLAALDPKLTVKRKSSDGDPNDYLPSAMTCFNILFITEYSTKEALEGKLLLAIKEESNSFEFS